MKMMLSTREINDTERIREPNAPSITSPNLGRYKHTINSKVVAVD